MYGEDFVARFAPAAAGRCAVSHGRFALSRPAVVPSSGATIRLSSASSTTTGRLMIFGVKKAPTATQRHRAGTYCSNHWGAQPPTQLHYDPSPTRHIGWEHGRLIARVARRASPWPSCRNGAGRLTSTSRQPKAASRRQLSSETVPHREGFPVDRRGDFLRRKGRARPLARCSCGTRSNGCRHRAAWPSFHLSHTRKILANSARLNSRSIVLLYRSARQVWWASPAAAHRLATPPTRSAIRRSAPSSIAFYWEYC